MSSYGMGQCCCGAAGVPLTSCGTAFEFVANCVHDYPPCLTGSPGVSAGLQTVPATAPPEACATAGMRIPAAWRALNSPPTPGCGWDGSEYVPNYCCAPGAWEFAYDAGATADVIPFDITVSLYDATGAFVSDLFTFHVTSTAGGPDITGSGTFSHGTNGLCANYFFLVVKMPQVNQTVGNNAVIIIQFCNSDVLGSGCNP